MHAFPLVSCEPEVTVHRALMPGALDRAVVGPYVFETALGRDVNLVFGVGFDAYGPFGDVDKDARDWNGVRAGVDDAGHVFAIPVEDEGNLSALCGGSAPIAGPGSGERMALLCKRRGREGQTCEKTRDLKYSHTASQSIFHAARFRMEGRAFSQDLGARRCA